MSFKVVFAVLFCGIYICLANPVPTAINITLSGNDTNNWQDLLKARNASSVSRLGSHGSNSSSIMDIIIGINAIERGSGIQRSDSNVFLFQGDIAIKRKQAIKLIQEGQQGTLRHRRAVMKKTRNNLWPKNNIRYYIDQSLGSVRGSITRAIGEWQRALPCMGNWKLARNGDYMHFFYGGGCYSRVGRVGGGQKISIGRGCHQHGVVVHEIGHAMGLWHEQSRPDRDSYVQIIWNNIIPAMKFNFEKFSRSRINSFNVPYDYGSVMHYGAYAFSRYSGQPTIRGIRSGQGKRLGQRSGLSKKDIEQVQYLYGCQSTGKPKTTSRPPPPSGCKDVQSLTNCNYWKNLSYCTKTYVAYMKKNCCKTCGGVKKTCPDTNTKKNCAYWKGQGYCTHSYVSFMKTNCCATCGF